MRVIFLWWHLFLLCIWINNLSAQTSTRLPKWQVGIEVGGVISAMVPSNQDIPYHSQRVGFRAGLYVQQQLPAGFALRSGVFYTLRGMYVDPAGLPGFPFDYWEMHGINVPLMVVYSLNDQVDVALGMEANGIVRSNYPLRGIPGLQAGPRGAVAFNWTTRLRIAAFYTHLLPRFLPSANAPGQPENFYNNIVSGISSSYRLTGDLVDQGPPLPEPPCPRY